MKFHIEANNPQIAAAFKRIDAKLGTTISGALKKSALIVEADAKRGSPVGVSGALRNSLTHEVLTDGLKYMALVGTAIKYAKWVEFGSKPHWAPLTDEIKLWFKRVLKMEEDEIEYGRGIWIKNKKTGKRRFLPFTVAPGLLEWAKRKGVHGRKAIFFKGKAQPFLIPAFNKNLSRIIDLISKATGEAIA